MYCPWLNEGVTTDFGLSELEQLRLPLPFPTHDRRPEWVEWWDLCQGRAPDACVLMQPRFDTRIGFWKGLRLYHDVNVPVGCFARSVAEAERDTWMLEAYGYSVSPTFHANPWAQRWPESRGHGAWAAVGSSR